MTDIEMTNIQMTNSESHTDHHANEESKKSKTALIVGVANERSLAWGVAQHLSELGYRLILTYPNEAIEKRVRPLGQAIGVEDFFHLDVTEGSHYESLTGSLKNLGYDGENRGIDFLLHGVAFAEREDLKGSYLETSRQGFLNCMEISVYSFTRLCAAVGDLFSATGSATTLTYYGSQKVIPQYNVMGVAKAALEASVRYLASDLGPKGVRVNGVSAGPVKTLAASGISGFREKLSRSSEKAPLRRNIQKEDVAGLCGFLASEASLNITGQILYVDSGLSILGE